MMRLASIQSLRAIAALMVVGFHISQWTGADFRIGAAGVDLFFVISGAVMWLSAVEADAAPATFLLRRAVRIVPAYWAATFACVAMAFLLPGLMIHLKPAPAHVALSLAFIPHLDPEGLPFPLLAQGWTLVYEAVFYLAVAAVLMLPAPGRMRALAGILVIIAATGFIIHPAYNLGANPMFLEFLAGAVVARLWKADRLKGAPAGGLMIGAGVTIFALLHVFQIHNDLWRPLLWGPASALIVAGALALEASGKAPRLAWLERLGDASYSLYLWHAIAVALVTLAVSDQHPAFTPLAFAAALAAAFVSRVLIEAPSLRLAHRLGRD